MGNNFGESWRLAQKNIRSAGEPMTVDPYVPFPRTWQGQRYQSYTSNEELEFTNEQDADDNPAGGHARGRGFHISWQDGPVNREAGEHASGAFVEDVLEALMNRMEFYQDSKFKCEENEAALRDLRSAYDNMLLRREDRKERGVLGKHEV